MNYLLLNFIIALWIESISSLFFGIFLLIKGTEKSHRIFGLHSLSVSWWSFCQIWEISCDKYSTSLFWGRIETIGVTFIATFFLHFVISFLQIKNKKWLIRLAYLISSIFGGLSLTKYMIATTAPKFYLKHYHVPGIIFHFMTVYFCICVSYAIWKVIGAYKNSLGEKKNKLKYLWLGELLGFASGSANFLLVYNINVPFLPFLTYLGSIWPAFVTYAILRHHLLDINIVIKRTAVYSILVTLITMLYFSLVYMMEFIFRGFVGYKSVPWTLSVIALFILIFQPLKNLSQSFVDKYFFKTSQATLVEELQKAQEELKRAERLKAVGTLAAGMAHEIKNPLTGIKTFTEYLSAKHSEPGFVDKFQKIVSTEVDRINSIVQQLLDFSKPKPLELKEINIHQIIDQTLSLLSNSSIKYKISIIKNYDVSLPSVYVDPNQIQQVFCNLFLNAIEAMKKGGKLIITTGQDKNIIKITISDTGEGIAKKDIEHIFDPFYTSKQGGTGLGMSITYGIIKEHKGAIKVESEKNKGASVTVTLPIKSAQ